MACTEGVVGFGFNCNNGGPEGHIAEAIIYKVRRMQRYTGQSPPLFVQKGIPLPDDLTDVTWMPEKDGARRPPTTLQICRQAVQWAREKRLAMLCIGCAAPHAWRCTRDMRRALAEAAGLDIETKLCPRIETHAPAYEKWFDPDSPCWWTRSPLVWKPRELILRNLPWKLYDRITS